jgi:hypothetical protein
MKNIDKNHEIIKKHGNKQRAIIPSENEGKMFNEEEMMVVEHV